MWILDLFKKKKTEEKKDLPTFYRRPVPGRIAVFTSGKGGVGKTTLSSSVS